VRSIGSDLAGASTRELVEAIAACAAELAARPAPDSAAACYEQAEALGLSADLMEAAIAARVARADREGEAQRWGFPSTASWLRSRLGMRHSRAEDRTVLARQLERLSRVAKRLAVGELSYGYASVIAAAVRRLGDEDCDKAEAILLELVDAGGTVKEVAGAGERIKELIAERDGTAPEPEDGRRGERQWWTMHHGNGGRSLSKGLFSAELAALIRAKIEPLAAPAGPEDARDHAQRMADALQVYLSEGDSRWDPIVILEMKQPPGTSRRPSSTQADHGQMAAVGKPLTAAHFVASAEIDRTTSIEPRRSNHGRWNGASGARPGGQRDGDGPAVRHQTPAPSWPVDGTPYSARLVDGTPIPTRRARDILINAGYSALVLGADGHPLYLGRRVRCATPHQRRALLARYSTCVVQDCDIPGEFCQIDHVDGWIDWGPTDIDKLALTCRFHNVYKYKNPDRVNVVLRGDGRYVYEIRRPGADLRRAWRSERRPGDRPLGRGP
jgi:hypothetical protein